MGDGGVWVEEDTPAFDLSLYLVNDSNTTYLVLVNILHQ